MFKVVKTALFIGVLMFSTGAIAENLLNNPESIVYDSVFNRYLVSNWADGNIVQIDSNGVQSYFYSELGGNVAGLHIHGNTLYAAANYSPNAGLVKIDLISQELVEIITLPGMQLLNGIATDTSGYIYVTDYYIHVIYKVNLSDNTSSVFIQDGLLFPNGLEFDKKNNRLLAINERATGNPIIAVNLEDSTFTELVSVGFGTDGLALDQFGYCYVSTWVPAAIYAFDSTFTNPPEEIPTALCGPADIYYDMSTYIMALPCFNQNKVEFICPFINIYANTTYGFPPLTVEFNGTSRLAAESWSWDFGDGESGAGQSATHTFQNCGIYDITAEITYEGHTIPFTERDYIIILADTAVAIDAQGDPGGTVEVEIYANNTLPLSSIRIPVEYSGSMGLTLDSFSTAGCRTENFDYAVNTHSDPVNRRASFRIYNDYDSEIPDLEPGNGTIFKLYFTISPYAPAGFTNPIIIDGYSSQVLRFAGPYLTYEPANVSGEVSLSGICGDANNDDVVNILDITYLISFLYKGGPGPAKPDMADVNNDGLLNLLDITYLINSIYKGGPDPQCSP